MSNVLEFKNSDNPTILVSLPDNMTGHKITNGRFLQEVVSIIAANMADVVENTEKTGEASSFSLKFSVKWSGGEMITDVKGSKSMPSLPLRKTTYIIDDQLQIGL